MRRKRKKNKFMTPCPFDIKKENKIRWVWRCFLFCAKKEEKVSVGEGTFSKERHPSKYTLPQPPQGVPFSLNVFREWIDQIHSVETSVPIWLQQSGIDTLFKTHFSHCVFFLPVTFLTYRQLDISNYPWFLFYSPWIDLKEINQQIVST